jgi:hypothetical protein
VSERVQRMDVNSTVCHVHTHDIHIFSAESIYIGFVNCGIFKQFLVIFFHFCRNVWTKKRLYHEEYVKFGFTIKQKKERRGYTSFSASCHAVLSNDARRPCHLEQYLNPNHKKLKDKPKAFLSPNFNA